MNRLMLPVMGTVLLCAQPFYALAADSTSPSTSASTHEQLREQMEAKRDQLSGAAQLSAPAQTGTATVQDAPVPTDDAPSQEQQP